MMCSISAPYSESVRAAVDPAMTWVRARPFTPLSGWVGSAVHSSGGASPTLRIWMRGVCAR